MTPAARAERIVRYALARHRGRVALACSFGGPAGMALLDIALHIDRSVPVFTVDTGVLFPQTHALRDEVARRYGIVPVVVRSELSLEGQAKLHGEALWERDPDLCCSLRKVEPHRAYLRGFDAWLTAIRRDQTEARAALQPITGDGDLVKISPLYDWTDDDVAQYVREHALPLNALHAEGYPSIGCVTCTRRPEPGADPRSGRWPGFAKTECGLHLGAEARVG